MVPTKVQNNDFKRSKLHLALKYLCKYTDADNIAFKRSMTNPKKPLKELFKHILPSVNDMSDV